MITRGQRQGGSPLILHSSSSIIKPRRISFTQRRLDEGWIQELIRANPELLPVDEIEPVFSPLISIGREVSTNVGSIDNLFISPHGYLTIVETKLWRNPGARREVIGQIIDYAKEVNKWSFSELEMRVKNYNEQYRGGNHNIIKTLQLKQEQIEENDEAFIIDSISRNLEHGRFLLIVVGDGIRESVEDMVDFLAQTPQLQFTLALMELQIYELDAIQEQSLLIIPQIVTRTREITRAIVKIEATNIKSIEIGVIEESASEEEKFFNRLSKKAPDLVGFAQRIIRDMGSLGCDIEWSSTYMVKYRNPGGSRQRFSLFYVYKDGLMNMGSLPDQLSKAGLPTHIGFDFVRSTASLFKDCEVHPKDPQTLSRYVRLAELQQQYDSFKTLVEETIEKIKTAIPDNQLGISQEIV